MNVACFSIKEIITRSQNKLETKLLLRHVLQLTAVELILANNRVLTKLEWQEFCKLNQRLLDKEPINYILGYREFYSRQFKVTKDTLIPRPETELLVDKVLALAGSRVQILELGTGSGCIAISIKLENPDLIVTAVEKSIDALAVAEENAQILGANVDFTYSDWYTNIGKQSFDIIVSNPPYIAINDQHLNNLTYEPKSALTDFKDGLDCFRQIIANAPKYLNSNGLLLVEHGYDQALSVQSLFRLNGFSEIRTYQDYADLDRITIGKCS